VIELTQFKRSNAMKRTLLVGLAVIGLLFMATGITFADALSDIMAAGELVVSTDANYAPQSYLNDDGKLEGFDISVALEAGKRLGVKVRHVTPDWDLITSGRWGKRWDVSIGSMAPTKERKKVLFFTKPYYAGPAQFVVHSSNKTIKTLDDLAGKVIGFATETTYDRYLNHSLELEGEVINYPSWKAKELRTYPTDANAIEDLALGDGARLDAVISAKFTLSSAIREGCGGGCPIKMLGEPVFYETMCFALDKSRADSESLLKKLDEIIKSMNEDGTLLKLSMKYYKTDLIPKLK
jgi:polar amino acid transport system substrate-binding protein